MTLAASSAVVTAAVMAWCLAAPSWPLRRVGDLGAGDCAGWRLSVRHWTRHRALPGWAIAGPVALVAAVVAGPVAAIAALVVCGVVGRRRRAASTASAADRERASAVEACAALAAELRAGRAAGPALGLAAELAVGSSREAMRRAAATVALGGDVPAALLVPPQAPAALTLRRLAACWQVSARSGAGLAAAVDELADGLRAQDSQRRELASELAGPRTTAALLAALPAIGIAFGAALGAAPLHFLLHHPAGIACLGAGLFLELAGLAWTDRLASGAQAALL